MKTKAIVVVAGLAAAALSLPASAQVSRGGLYLGAGVGQSEFKFSCDTSPCDTKGKGFKLFGGYQFTRNIGAEVTYTDLGETTFGDANVEATVWDLSAIGSYPVARGLSVYARLGLYNGDAKASVPSTGQEIKATRDGLVWGIGGLVDVTRNFGARVEWQSFNKMGGGDFGETANVNLLSLSGVWRFE